MIQYLPQNSNKQTQTMSVIADRKYIQNIHDLYFYTSEISLVLNLNHISRCIPSAQYDVSLSLVTGISLVQMSMCNHVPVNSSTLLQIVKGMTTWIHTKGVILLEISRNSGS